MSVIKSIYGKLLDWSGLANVPAALAALTSLKGNTGQILSISETDADGVATAFEAVDKPTGGNDSGQNVDLTGYAKETWVQEGFQPKGNYLTTAPVTSINGKTGAVNLSASDVGALPKTYTPPDQTAEQVGADPTGTAESRVSAHNTDTASHNDLRLELKALSDRLTAFFDSDDTTLDELSEIVAYITNNKTLIASITTSKVSVSDIIDNLTTNVSNKPLSAAQGVVLKGLCDAVSNSLSNYQPKGDYALASAVPTKVSQLTNDKGYLTEHQEAVLYIAQNLTEAQKAQARANIGATAGDDVEFADSVEWLNEYGDTTKKYVLPDGYIYTYTQKSVTVEHNANDGTGLINQRPVTNGTTTEFQTQSGVWTSPLIEIDPTVCAPTGERIAESTVVISGIDKIVPALNSSSVWVWYYGEDGAKQYVLKGSKLSLGTDDEIALPTEFYLFAESTFNTINWSKVRYVKILLGISTSGDISEADIANLKVNIPFFDYETDVYGWYSTGQQHSNDKATQQNSADIAVLKEDVAALKDAVENPSSQSGAVWYAVGDSITKGYGVGAENCWVANVLKYNGYDSSKSVNLGISGLGFAKTDPNYGKTARTVVDENDFSAVDLVTVAIGINDWKEPFSIETVKSEMSYCFEKILTDNPYCKIFFITPLNMNRGTKSTNYALGYSGSDVTGGTLEEFVAAQVSVCEQYGIEVIDLTHSSVVNRVNLETVLYDGIHPDASGHLALGRELARRITFA